MLDEDVKAIEKWQSEPEGKAATAVHALHSALDATEDQMATRTGYQEVRKLWIDLARAQTRINRIVDSARPHMQTEAAE